MMIAATMDITMMILPVAGCMLMAFGIYQAITDSRNQEKSKIIDRLQDRAAKPVQAEKIKESLLRTQNLGRTRWYSHYKTRIAKVERDYGV